MNNTTSSPVKNNGTYVNVSGYNAFYRTRTTIIAQTVSLAVLGAITVLGNLASIITFVKTQSLRRRSNYLIICLAVSDLLVGVVDFMLAYYLWSGPQRNSFIIVLEVMDNLFLRASILTLSNISIERFYAIFYPFRHRRLRFRAYVGLCAFPWIAATYITVLFVSSRFHQIMLVIYTYHILSVVTIALLVILVSYITIGVKLRKSNPSAQNQNRPSKDQKLAITLLIVTLGSMLTWLPLQCCRLVLYFCHSCVLSHFNVFFVMRFLQYCNSGINVFIYIVRMPEFRSAFLVLFCGKKEENVRFQESTRMTSNVSVKNNGFVGDESETRQTCRNRSMACPKNNSNLPSYNNQQNMPRENVQGPYQVNNSNLQNGVARANINPTNQNARNCNKESKIPKENESKNTKKPGVTQESESSLDKMKETRDKEPGSQQGFTNHAVETEESGSEDSTVL